MESKTDACVFRPASRLAEGDRAIGIGRTGVGSTAVCRRLMAEIGSAIFIYSHVFEKGTAAMKNDSELKRDLENELMWEPSVTEAHIGVSVSNGEIGRAHV